MQNPVDLSEAKVLMVDDTPANIDVLRKVLSVEGYKLSFANSGEKALQIAARAQPDLILLDVMMPPGMDGYETCQRLKADEATRDIPVIFITAKTDTGDVVTGFQYGAVDYIAKPFQQEEVRVRVRTHLQARLLMKQQQRLLSDLRASEKRFRLLSTRSPIGIFQIDPQGRCVYVNPFCQQLFDIAPESTPSNSWLQHINSEDRERVIGEWSRCVMHKEDFSTRCRLDLLNGETCWIEIHAVPLTGVDDELEGFIGVVEDITEIKLNEDTMRQAKEQAESEAKAKSEHIASMTHELRTPLNAIIGYSEMLGEELNDDRDREDLDKITSASKYLLNLINNLLDLSKIEANKMPLILEEVELGPLLKDVSSTLTPLFNKKQNRLITDYPDDPGTIRADSTKIRQILFNLLSNANKFTQSGEITLGLKYAEEEGKRWVYFTVHDTGIGMTPEQMERLFQKYMQATDDTSRLYGGTGLGLVVCRQLSRMMGGDISVASEYGKGTTFTVRIPARVETPAAQ
jgi:PAS domain S-box-containing protein